MNVWILIVGVKWFSNDLNWPWIVFDACNSYFWYIKILVWVWWRDFFFIGVRFFGCRFWGLKDIVDEHPWPSDGQPRISLGPNPLPRTAPDRGDTLDRVKLRLHSNQFIFTSCLNSSNWSSLTVEFSHFFVSSWNCHFLPTTHRFKYFQVKNFDFELNIKYLVLISADWFLSSRRLYDISV